MRCPHCGGDAYLCDRPHHGTASWAFHCKSSIRHNLFGAPGTQPPTSWEGSADRGSEEGGER